MRFVFVAVASIAATLLVGHASAQPAPASVVTEAPAPPSTTSTPLGDLLRNPAARAMLQVRMPSLLDNPQIELARHLTLKDLQAFDLSLTDETLAVIDRDFADLTAE